LTASEYNLHVFRAVWNIEGKAETVLPHLLGRSLDDESSELLAAMGPAAKPALPQLRALMQRGSAIDRTAAAGAICSVEQKADSLPVVCEALRHPDKGVRLAAIAALQRLGPLAKEALPALREATEDCELAVRVAARRALQSIATSKAN
jgi:HEAT repeat protein